jgi:hypothetical protein
MAYSSMTLHAIDLTAATHAKTWATDSAKGSLVVPSGAAWAAGASWDAYPAELSDSSSGNSLGMPLLNRRVWLVELNGINRPDGSEKVLLPGVSPPPEAMIHHVVDVWDDLTGRELFCS